jgi:hypothetical protein
MGDCKSRQFLAPLAFLKNDGAAIAVIPISSTKANEDVMAKEDRLCAFCGKESGGMRNSAWKTVRNFTWLRAGAGLNILKLRLTRNGMVRIDKMKTDRVKFLRVRNIPPRPRRGTFLPRNVTIQRKHE